MEPPTSTARSSDDTGEALSFDSGRFADDLFWDGLLLRIEERRVVPVVGPGLIGVPGENGEEPILAWCARNLAQMLRVPARPSSDGEPLTLNEVVCAHLEARRDISDVYIALTTLLDRLKVEPSETLRTLTAIEDFDCFVTTTFDSLLAQAIAAVRPNDPLRVLAYTPGRVIDLPAPLDKLDGVTVYHLFGKAGPTPSYAVSDEDWLEFVCQLQSPSRMPEKLFAELEQRDLLLLGCDFAGWLGRLFLRTTRRRRLSDRRDVREIMADGDALADKDLVFFLQHFSHSTKIFQGGDAKAFVAELSRRWQERHAGSDAKRPAERERTASPREMPDGAVFISYTRKDLEAVQRLKTGLDAAGIPAWLDVVEMIPGDLFAEKIMMNIDRCAVFVPVISANTEARREAFFYREWDRALERKKGMAPDARFILPIVIDDTKPPWLRVPAGMVDKHHYTSLPGGRIDEAFAAAVAKVRADNLDT